MTFILFSEILLVSVWQVCWIWDKKRLHLLASINLSSSCPFEELNHEPQERWLTLQSFPVKWIVLLKFLNVFSRVFFKYCITADYTLIQRRLFVYYSAFWYIFFIHIFSIFYNFTFQVKIVLLNFLYIN